MRKIRPSFPRRRELLATAFEPLSDADFLRLVSDGSAIPGRQGSSLIVAKWRDGPGMDPQAFLSALKQQGLSLEVRRFKSDVNVRVARGKRAASGRPPAAARGTSAEVV
jgi:hypothetical protein